MRSRRKSKCCSRRRVGRPRKPGRPKGSKNKRKSPRRKSRRKSRSRRRPGRPKGSKNKRKSPRRKSRRKSRSRRRPGRPKGSKNKRKSPRRKSRRKSRRNSRRRRRPGRPKGSKNRRKSPRSRKKKNEYNSYAPEGEEAECDYVCNGPVDLNIVAKSAECEREGKCGITSMSKIDSGRGICLNNQCFNVDNLAEWKAQQGRLGKPFTNPSNRQPINDPENLIKISIGRNESRQPHRERGRAHVNEPAKFSLDQRVGILQPRGWSVLRGVVIDITPIAPTETYPFGRWLYDVEYESNRHLDPLIGVPESELYRVASSLAEEARLDASLVLLRQHQQ